MFQAYKLLKGVKAKERKYKIEILETITIFFPMLINENQTNLWSGLMLS